MKNVSGYVFSFEVKLVIPIMCKAWCCFWGWFCNGVGVVNLSQDPSGVNSY